jgi:adenine deaminase
MTAAWRSAPAVRADDPRTLVAVALGERPADLVVRGGTLANVYTGELLPGWGVAVAGGRVALVGPEAEARIGPATTVLEAEGNVIAPGYIDGHTHLDYLHRLDHYLQAAIPTGLTTVVTETIVLAAVGGYPAVEAFLAALPELPVTVLATAPTIAYLLAERDGAPALSAEEMARLLEEPGVIGLGETYWPAALTGREELPLLIAKAEALGKTVEGHGAGARGPKLSAFVATGVSSCHEPITAEEVWARLRLGLFTMIRDGSIRRDSGALKGGLPDLAAARLMLASDTVWGDDLLARGYLDESARQAVAMGLSPMQALRAVTLTPAEHFRLDARLGGLAPGRQADLLLLPALETFRPRVVVARGQVVAQAGEMAVAVPPVLLPADRLPRPRLPQPFGLEQLAIPAPPGRDRVRVRVLHFAADILTEERVQEVPVCQGILPPDPDADRLKVMALDRSGSGRMTRGFVSGYGLRRGALALSLSFDTSNLVLLGADDRDILVAAERMLVLGGGGVVVADGAVRAELPLPLGGITSEQPLAAVARQLQGLQDALRGLGCVRANPFLSALVLTFTAIPAFRIRERGLWDVRRDRVVPLIVEGGAG